MDIKIADFRKLNLEEYYNEASKIVSENDLNRAEKFVKKKDRIRSLMGSFFIKSELPKDCEIYRNDYGKPYVTGEENIYFSLSHSGEMIVYAFDDTEIGIDVEEVKEIKDFDYSVLLNEYERDIIKKSDDKYKKFFKFWTVREAFSKKIGIGISVFEKESIYIDYDNEYVLYKGRRLYFKSFYVDNHVISICTDEEKPEIRINFISEKELKKRLSN